jgi:hypothetical protein
VSLARVYDLAIDVSYNSLSQNLQEDGAVTALGLIARGSYEANHQPNEKLIDNCEQLSIIPTQFISIDKRSNGLSGEHILGAVVAQTQWGLSEVLISVGCSDSISLPSCPWGFFQFKEADNEQLTNYTFWVRSGYPQ